VVLSSMVRVLFVCLGNICRSPTAHGVFDGLVQKKSLQSAIEVDSAGTGDWHLGEEPDKRSQVAAAVRGYDLSYLRARQVSAEDFRQFDYILAMDKKNLADLQSMRPSASKAVVELFLSFSDSGNIEEVPDPYYGEEGGFEQVLDLVESAATGLLQSIQTKHKL